MLRFTLMLATSFAFALPFALPFATAARPLTSAAPEVGFCWGDDCDDGDEPIEIDLQLCVTVQIGEEEHRDCQVREGPACLAACTFDAVGPACLSEVGDRATPRELAACQTDSVAVCRSQCEAGGAAFCERGHPGQGLGHCKNAGNPGHPEYEEDCEDKEYDHDDHDDYDDTDDHDDDDDDGGGGGGGVVFVDVLACIGVGIEAG